MTHNAADTCGVFVFLFLDRMKKNKMVDHNPSVHVVILSLSSEISH